MYVIYITYIYIHIYNIYVLGGVRACVRLCLVCMILRQTMQELGYFILPYTTLYIPSLFLIYDFLLRKVEDGEVRGCF